MVLGQMDPIAAVAAARGEYIIATGHVTLAIRFPEEDS
jgi:hypothetical protein